MVKFDIPNLRVYIFAVLTCKRCFDYLIKCEVQYPIIYILLFSLHYLIILIYLKLSYLF